MHLVYKLILYFRCHVTISALMLTIWIRMLHLLLLCGFYCVIIFDIHIIWTSCILAPINWYSIVCCRCSSTFSLSLRSSSFIKRSEFVTPISSSRSHFFMLIWIGCKLIEILIINVLLIWRIARSPIIIKSWWCWTPCSITFVSVVCFVLKIHWIMCLIVQKSLSLEEILSPLESTLLLHLLERVLIALQNVTCLIVKQTFRVVVIVVLI